MFAIVINKDGYKMEFVALNEDKTVQFYELKEDEQLIEKYWQFANAMNKPKWNFETLEWEETESIEDEQIENCLDDLKLEKIRNSKLQLETWLQNNPLFSTVHNAGGDYYTVTDEKQSLLARNLLLAQLSQSTTTTWNSTSNICEKWEVVELAQLALEIEVYVRPRITKQQHYEVAIKSCQTKEELDLIAFDYEVI